jgi:hypothetical protein
MRSKSNALRSQSLAPKPSVLTRATDLPAGRQVAHDKRGITFRSARNNRAIFSFLILPVIRRAEVDMGSLLPAQRFSRVVQVRRIGRRILRGIRRARKVQADRLECVLLREHNARPDQEVYRVFAESVARTLQARGFRTQVHAFETEQMGGQHMEWVNHVFIEVILRKPAPWSRPRVLTC